ncbi:MULTISPECIES: PGAP1-like alpha/beta domain-containing protein [Wolbachia]|uniref:Alpha/beta hydrolase n=1 Tax=Wolbachia pipientis TaxID=955 RepID=A0A7G5CBZ7_WOLPI|nr:MULTISPECIES: alpha/beta hydrolase [Wolbachia]MDE5060938.1 alpha/beta hydrolase [Wolbachia endosymbiont of Drosophila nikananu]QMV46731.1 alpha/beta hydrolase [Wolbachia pipientis]
MHITKCNKENEVHLIFFHGIGDNYKSAHNYVQSLNESNNNHAHKYPSAFQNYITYAAVSFLFFVASVSAPIAMLLLISPITAGVVGLASLAALTCIFLSVMLIFIPFINRDQSLLKPSIEKINELMGKGVKPENIILFGHSFGGAVASAVLKHFADKNVKLGGVIFTSTFSSFHTAIGHFPIPQAKILSMLPSSILKKLLKALDLDFDLVNDIRKLRDEGKLNMPVIVINSKRDHLIPQPAQLAHAIENDVLPREKLIKTVNSKSYEDDPHNGVLSSWELGENLTDLILNKIDKTMNR